MSKDEDKARSVFIVGVKEYTIYYLADSRQIVSRLERDEAKMPPPAAPIGAGRGGRPGKPSG
jgi:hypothetical protein